MTKIEKLIQQLCPNGVEYETLENVSEIKRGIRVVKSQLNESGKYPVYQNSLTPLGFYEQNNAPANTTFIIVAGAAGEIGYSICDFWAADDCFYFLPSAKLLNRYIYHFMLMKQPYLLSKVRKASIPRLARSAIEKLNIPVPPLEVQREIVRILDQFTELTAELTAELTSRKKQYGYYRDKLLMHSKEVTWMTLGDIGNVCMCKRIMKAETSREGDVPFFKIGTFGKEPDAYISQEKFDEYREKYSFPKKGDVLISAAGTIGRTVIYDGKPAYYQDSNIVWLDNDETKVLNKYLFYYYQLQPWAVSTGGTIARLYNDNISKAKIAVPSLEEQRRIVSILDHFDVLCNDLTSGLPAEIETHRKQYEYYRDKLLNFPECIKQR